MILILVKIKLYIHRSKRVQCKTKEISEFLHKKSIGNIFKDMNPKKTMYLLMFLLLVCNNLIKFILWEYASVTGLFVDFIYFLGIGKNHVFDNKTVKNIYTKLYS